jgi:hypothetical protein
MASSIVFSIFRISPFLDCAHHPIERAKLFSRVKQSVRYRIVAAGPFAHAQHTGIHPTYLSQTMHRTIFNAKF